MSKLMSATATFAVIFAAATSAHADVRRMILVDTAITYSDAELASASGSANVLQRINNAAARLCAPHSPVSQPYSHSTRLCMAKAIAKAVDTLDAPLVTAAYARRFPAPERVLAAR